MAEVFRYKRIKLASVSDSSSGLSDTESVYSLQGKETECARDTSDTSDNFEFEVAGCENYVNVLFSSSDESELQDIAELGAVVASMAYEDENVDIAIQADSSEENSTSPTSNSDIDPELPRSDFLDFEHCLMCRTRNKNISYPYCTNCFLWRKSFFPPRPEKKKKQKPKLSFKENDTIKETSESMVDIKGMRSDSSGIKSSSQESSFDESTYNSSQDKSLCKICCTREMNAVFVHGSSGHLYACYMCAIKTWKNIGVCPLCRKKCWRVIRLFTSMNE